ncbi:MAG TPA: MgtC/SapB family protein [Acidimicrobiales bacterium]|jgi:putative Mg2+ transporter-C (MgtC) family protein|uniref:MgtC/SapB/SrpB/YhiD N-terminal domain-containing protein n=1 Tax=marine metagenome TaxID=408172 RepID=A0A382S1A2_9ZZZZ|nr:MgtC/SapB family protein [Actinomycetes bacterium]MDP6105145.1 MgtC/SapB family protein [Acidimicrobiales bacterium]MCP4845441.1 MgtC/SapB family protein [Actinomycetes bacterium]MDP6239492.1 MgtC/SapB family protein [Acidimicrobiales bacterium]MDP7124129.1 MgtC/SapB family protein [Acidimicrobiales bacterium]|tara:strand:- start:5729 stop:6349 length:621 start_codon:yes stop_codon:yes gene_type:complete
MEEELVKMLLAVALGGAIGFERELREKAAGIRTIILITLASTLFTLTSIEIAGDADPGRVAAQIVTGVGFLGGGVILKERGSIVGITTAATIWMAAAVGVAIGIGEYAVATATTAVAFSVLLALPLLERRIATLSSQRYRITCSGEGSHRDEVRTLFTDSGLKVRRIVQTKSDRQSRIEVDASGRPTSHQAVRLVLFKTDFIKDFR